ncbi:MAG TPA: SDR family oxidoreductase [Solirubrobacteraceae bacterium]|nr:SDR family oxidoreductase [Solirubrobacteraceae bacterium]
MSAGAGELGSGRGAEPAGGEGREILAAGAAVSGLGEPDEGTDGPGESEVFAPGTLGGRVALVTGGGTGLGRATALELARCGAAVTVVGRREDPLRETAAAIGLERAQWLAGDVRERGEARRLVATALERWGRLDLLVNNAGGQYFTPAEGIVAKGWGAVWRLNVDGMLNMAHEVFAQAFAVAAGGLGGGGGGAAACVGGDAPTAEPRIVNVTLSPHHGMPGMAHSGAARATVEALTRELAVRWASNGVTVCAVAAGHFDTEAMGKYPDVVRAGMARSVPLQRLGTVQEHAWLVALLASPLGAAFNGSTVTLDGARDNWFGPWPPPGLADAGGDVPTESRRGGGGTAA